MDGRDADRALQYHDVGTKNEQEYALETLKHGTWYKGIVPLLSGSSLPSIEEKHYPKGTPVLFKINFPTTGEVTISNEISESDIVIMDYNKDKFLKDVFIDVDYTKQDFMPYAIEATQKEISNVEELIDSFNLRNIIPNPEEVIDWLIRNDLKDFV